MALRNRATSKDPLVAERRERVLSMWAAGYSFADIAAALNVTEAVVRQDKHRAMKSYVDYQRQPVEELRARELASLDKAQRVADAVMDRDHVAHSNGRVVKLEDEVTGELTTVIDDGPKLAAIDRVVKISESRRKLLGEDAPSKVEQTMGGTVEYVIRVDGAEMDQL